MLTTFLDTFSISEQWEEFYTAVKCCPLLVTYYEEPFLFSWTKYDNRNITIPYLSLILACTGATLRPTELCNTLL